MGGRTINQKRLDELKGLLAKLRVTPKTKIVDVEVEPILRIVLECDPKSLERAADFFGLALGHTPNLLMLAHLLAEIVFGKPVRGRRWPSKTWDGPAFQKLMRKYEWLKRKNPKLNNTEIAEILSRYHEYKEYRRDPSPLRKRLSAVRKLRRQLDEELAIWGGGN